MSNLCELGENCKMFQFLKEGKLLFIVKNRTVYWILFNIFPNFFSVSLFLIKVGYKDNSFNFKKSKFLLMTKLFTIYYIYVRTIYIYELVYLGIQRNVKRKISIQNWKMWPTSKRICIRNCPSWS